MGVVIVEGKDSLGVNVGRRIVTNVNFVAYLCESDAPFPNYFGSDLYSVCQIVVGHEAGN